MGNVLIFLVLLMFVPPIIAIFVFISRYREGQRDTGAKDRLFEAMMEMQNRKNENGDISADDSKNTEKIFPDIPENIPEEKCEDVLSEEETVSVNDAKQPDKAEEQPNKAEGQLDKAEEQPDKTEEQLKKEEALKRVSAMLDRNKTKKTKNKRAELFDALSEISKRNKR